MKLIYPGSFDPITNGHLDIINRASAISEKLYIAVLINPQKKGLFDQRMRIKLIEDNIRTLKNVEVISFSGLLVDLFQHYEIDAIVKGLRAISDFEYEFQMAQINREIETRAETLFMMTSPQYAYLSSSIVKELHQFGGPIEEFVPPNVVAAMNNKAEEV